MKTKKTLIIASLAIAPFLVSAARVDLGIAVGTAPPPPPPTAVVTPVVPPPGPAYVWVPGHYDWVGGQWVWVEGGWTLPPRPHAVWVAPAVDIRLHRGHWR